MTSALKSYNPLRRRHELVLNNFIKSAKCSVITDVKSEILKFSTDIGIFNRFYHNFGDSKSENENESYKAPIVIDNGSHTITSGFGGDDTPRSVFNTIIGKSKQKKEKARVYTGHQVWSYRGLLNLHYPIKNGIITDFDGIETILDYMYKTELRVEPSERNVLMSEKPLNSFENRKKMTEIMFEKFNVPGLFIITDSIPIIFASGGNSGLVVNMGHNISHIVPVYEGFCVPYGIKTLNLGGKQITDYLNTLLSKKGYKFRSAGEIEIVRDIKEKTTYIAPNFDEELKKSKNTIEKRYELPDGEILTIGNERFRAPEILFKPNIIGLNDLGIDKLIINSIKSCENDITKLLCQNTVLAGGCSMFPLLNDRLDNELNKLKSKNNISYKSAIIAPPERKYTVWIGCSIIADSTGFDEYWNTKQQYNEYGTNIVYRSYV